MATIFFSKDGMHCVRIMPLIPPKNGKRFILVETGNCFEKEISAIRIGRILLRKKKQLKNKKRHRRNPIIKRRRTK